MTMTNDGNEQDPPCLDKAEEEASQAVDTFHQEAETLSAEATMGRQLILDATTTRIDTACPPRHTTTVK